MWFISGRRLLQAMKDAPGKQLTRQQALAVLTTGFPGVGPEAIQRIQDQLEGGGWITSDATKHTLTAKADGIIDLNTFSGAATDTTQVGAGVQGG